MIHLSIDSILVVRNKNMILSVKDLKNIINSFY